MAFQSNTVFIDFLRSTTGTANVEESGPAVNFVLEERLPAVREQRFLSEHPDPTAITWDVASWWTTFTNHYSEHVALPSHRAQHVATFAPENSENHLPLESHQDVVRLESLKAFHQLYPGDFDTPAELANELRSLITSRLPSKTDTFSPAQHSRLTLWLEGLNHKRDARPAFAAPFGEVEPLLAAPDWATQLRNVLGLSHLGGAATNPLPVVLCRYSLSRVEQEARKARRSTWAAAPTVLEAGGNSGPGPAFFPFPKQAASSNPLGFGITVDLSSKGGLDFKAELLHSRLDYTLDDFVMVGEFKDMVSNTQLLAARQRHFGLLEEDFTHRDDVQF